MVAIKKVKISENDNTSDGLPHFLLREMTVLKELQGHENIVNLIEMFRYKSSVILVFEYVDGGDLQKYI